MITQTLSIPPLRRSLAGGGNFRMGEILCTIRLFRGFFRVIIASSLQQEVGDGAGALFYPIEGFTGKERGRKILEFRDALEAAILREAGEDVIRFIGGASGLRFAYLDLLAWDLPAALAAAKRILEAGPLPWAGFHSFCRGEDVLVLLDRP